MATNIANQNQLPPWLAATNPNIVLMHLGTNDLFSGTNTTEMVLAAYSKKEDQQRCQPTGQRRERRGAGRVPLSDGYQHQPQQK